MGPYQIISQLGRSGMGEVYLAEDIRLERKVALKVLPAAFTQQPERVRRFEREAKAASALNHPNILTIYEVGEASTEVGGAHYIVSEFVEGETVRALIERGGLDISQTLTSNRHTVLWAPLLLISACSIRRWLSARKANNPVLRRWG